MRSINSAKSITMSKLLVVSIKTEYAEKIFSGQKSIELRKSTPSVIPGDTVIIYNTSPIKAVTGLCKVKEIIRLKPAEMWEKYHAVLGIDKVGFDKYFINSDKAIGIVLTDICKLDTQVSLKTIKQIFPFFQPPQTFRYYNKSYVFKAYLQKAV